MTIHAHTWTPTGREWVTPILASDGNGKGWDRAPARELRCACGADRMEFHEGGQWKLMYERTWD